MSSLTGETAVLGAVTLIGASIVAHIVGHPYAVISVAIAFLLGVIAGMALVLRELKRHD